MFKSKFEVKKFCHSLKCCGPRGIKVEKSVGKTIVDCPDCKHALISQMGNKARFSKRTKLPEQFRYLPEGA